MAYTSSKRPRRTTL